MEVGQEESDFHFMDRKMPIYGVQKRIDGAQRCLCTSGVGAQVGAQLVHTRR